MIGQTLVTCAALELEAEPTRLNPCTQEKGQRRPTTLTLTSLYEAARNVAVDSGRHFPHSVALRFNCSEAPPGCSPPCSLSSPPAPHQTRWKPGSPGLRCPARDEGSPPHPHQAPHAGEDPPRGERGGPQPLRWFPVTALPTKMPPTLLPSTLPCFFQLLLRRHQDCKRVSPVAPARQAPPLCGLKTPSQIHRMIF